MLPICGCWFGSYLSGFRMSNTLVLFQASRKTSEESHNSSQSSACRVQPDIEIKAGVTTTTKISWKHQLADPIWHTHTPIAVTVCKHINRKHFAAWARRCRRIGFTIEFLRRWFINVNCDVIVKLDGKCEVVIVRECAPWKTKAQ